MKPLSEQELREKLELIVFAKFYDIPDKQRKPIIENLLKLIIQDRKAWGEQILEDLKLTASKHYYTRGYGEPTILVREWLDYLDLKIKKQRNQGEKD